MTVHGELTKLHVKNYNMKSVGYLYLTDRGHIYFIQIGYNIPRWVYWDNLKSSRDGELFYLKN